MKQTDIIYFAQKPSAVAFTCFDFQCSSRLMTSSKTRGQAVTQMRLGTRQVTADLTRRRHDRILALMAPQRDETLGSLPVGVHRSCADRDGARLDYFCVVQRRRVVHTEATERILTYRNRLPRCSFYQRPSRHKAEQSAVDRQKD